VNTVYTMLKDESLTPAIRHQVLQLALVFMCSMDQLSPGAYFLRRDFTPVIISFITNPDTERYSFEAILLLSSLANFHKQETAGLSPVLVHLRDSDDAILVEKVVWASNFAMETAIRCVVCFRLDVYFIYSSAYQEISKESRPTIVQSIGSMVASFVPLTSQESTKDLLQTLSVVSNSTNLTYPSLLDRSKRLLFSFQFMNSWRRIECSLLLLGDLISN
jgi:hypothetical protein